MTSEPFSHEEPLSGPEQEFADWDAAVSQLCDMPLPAAGSSDAPDIVTPGEWDTRTHQRVAGLQFLHALLMRIHRPNPAGLELQIQGVLARLDQEAAPHIARPHVPSISGGRVRRGLWLGRFMTLASLLLAIGFIWYFSGGMVTAANTVQRALVAAQDAQDREYQVVALIRSDRNIDREVTCQLHVRGANQYVLSQPGLMEGSRLWIGRSGEQSWLIPIWGPVLVTDDHHWGNSTASDADRPEIRTPYLQLTTILDRLQNRYELEFLPREELPLYVGAPEIVSFQRVRGVLIGEEPAWPHQIDVWVHPETDDVRRLHLDWLPPAGRPGLRKIMFDLVNHPDLPDDWYTHEAHHSPERMVITTRKRGE